MMINHKVGHKSSFSKEEIFFEYEKRLEICRYYQSTDNFSFSNSGIPRWRWPVAGKHKFTQFRLLVADGIMQCMCSNVAPEAI